MLKLPELANTENDRFLDEAFDGIHHDKLEKKACILRNIFLLLFILGTSSIVISIFLKPGLWTVGAVIFSTTTLMVTTRFDTRLFFLRNLKLRDTEPHID